MKTNFGNQAMGSAAKEAKETAAAERAAERAERSEQAVSGSSKRSSGQQAATMMPAPAVPDLRDLVTWREEVDVRTEATKIPQKFKIQTYITENRVQRQVDVEWQEARIIREPIPPQEAMRLTPREIQEQTKDFEIELAMVEAVVSKKLVPAERIRVETETKHDMVVVDEMLKSEHFKVQEPPHGDSDFTVRHEGYTNLGRPSGGAHRGRSEGLGR